jgi:hypothetical protein
MKREYREGAQLCRGVATTKRRTRQYPGQGLQKRSTKKVYEKDPGQGLPRGGHGNIQDKVYKKAYKKSLQTRSTKNSRKKSLQTRSTNNT